MNNLQIDLLQESLMTMLRDKYSMSPHWEEFSKKYELIRDTYELLEGMRTKEDIKF